MIKDYNKVIELSNLTLEDCSKLYEKNILTIINDGRVINLENEKEKF